MNIAAIRKLAKRGEDSRLQYKSNVRNVDSLAAEMAAFANCEGGQILIGVGDNGELDGISRSEVGRINQLISNAASQHVRSPLSPQTKNISVGRSPIISLLNSTSPSIQGRPPKSMATLASESSMGRTNAYRSMPRLFPRASKTASPRASAVPSMV